MTGVTEVNSDPNIDIELKKEAGGMQGGITNAKDVACDEGESTAGEHIESQTGHTVLFNVRSGNCKKDWHQFFAWTVQTCNGVLINVHFQKCNVNDQN